MKPFVLFTIKSVLVVILTGTITDSDIKNVRNTILEEISRINPSGLIIDISQLDTVDSYTVRIMTDISRMAKLLGPSALIIGLSPAIVITMVEMGLDFKEINAAANIDQALEQFGVKLVPKVTI